MVSGGGGGAELLEHDNLAIDSFGMFEDETFWGLGIDFEAICFPRYIG